MDKGTQNTKKKYLVQETDYRYILDIRERNNDTYTTCYNICTKLMLKYQKKFIKSHCVMKDLKC